MVAVACRMSAGSGGLAALPVGVYVRRGDGRTSVDRGFFALEAQVREQFLIAEIRRFLKRQPLRHEKRVGDRQDHLTDTRVLLFDAEPILPVSPLRENTNKSELRTEIPCHRSVPFSRPGWD